MAKIFRINRKMPSGTPIIGSGQKSILNLDNVYCIINIKYNIYSPSDFTSANLP
jgi:hypothetical protein